MEIKFMKEIIKMVSQMEKELNIMKIEIKFMKEILNQVIMKEKE